MPWKYVPMVAQSRKP